MGRHSALRSHSARCKYNMTKHCHACTAVTHGRMQGNPSLVPLVAVLLECRLLAALQRGDLDSYRDFCATRDSAAQTVVDITLSTHGRGAAGADTARQSQAAGSSGQQDADLSLQASIQRQASTGAQPAGAPAEPGSAQDLASLRGAMRRLNEADEAYFHPAEHRGMSPALSYCKHCILAPRQPGVKCTAANIVLERSVMLLACTARCKIEAQSLHGLSSCLKWHAEAAQVLSELASKVTRQRCMHGAGNANLAVHIAATLFAALLDDLSDTGYIPQQPALREALEV